MLSLLSRTFQQRSINFSQIQPSSEITVASLQAIPEQNKALSRVKSDFGEGRRFHFLSSEISITQRVLERASTIQVKYVTKLVENIHNRFDSDAMSVVSAFKTFHPMELPSKESEKWADYELAEVKTLAQHFFPSNKMFDQVTAEFCLLKYHMQTLVSNAKNASSTEICLSTLFGNSAYTNLMPAIVQIAEVTLSMPVSNTWPEPGVSTVKRITTRLKGWLWESGKPQKREERSNGVYRLQCQKAVMWVAKQKFKTAKFCYQMLEHPLKINHWRVWNRSTC